MMSTKRKPKYDERGMHSKEDDYRRMPQHDNRPQRWHEDSHVKKEYGRSRQQYEQGSQYKYQGQGMPKPRYPEQHDRNVPPQPKYRQDGNQTYEKHVYRDESIKYEQKQQYTARTKSRDSANYRQLHHQYKDNRKIDNFLSDKRSSVSQSPSVGSRARSPSYSSNDSYVRKKSSSKHHQSLEELEIYQKSPEKVKPKKERGRSREKRKKQMVVDEEMLPTKSIDIKQEERKHKKKKLEQQDNGYEKQEKSISQKKRKKVANSPEPSEEPKKKIKTHKKNVHKDIQHPKKEKKVEKKHRQQLEDEDIEAKHRQVFQVYTDDSEFEEMHKKKSLHRKASAKHSSSQSIETSQSQISQPETELESHVKSKKKKHSKHRMDEFVSTGTEGFVSEEEQRKTKVKKKQRESLEHNKIDERKYKKQKIESPEERMIDRHQHQEKQYQKPSRRVKEDEYDDRYSKEQRFADKHGGREQYDNIKQQYEKHDISRENRPLKSTVKYSNNQLQQRQSDSDSYQSHSGSSYKQQRRVEKVYVGQTGKQYKQRPEHTQHYDGRRYSSNERQYETKVKVMRHTGSGRPEREVVYQPTHHRHEQDNVRKHSDNFTRRHDNVQYSSQQPNFHKNISYSENRNHSSQSTHIREGRTTNAHQQDFQYKSRNVRQENFERKNTDYTYVKNQAYNNQSNDRFRDSRQQQQGNAFYKKPFNDNRINFTGNRRMQPNDRPIVYDDRKKFVNRKIDYQNQNFAEKRQIYTQRQPNRDYQKPFEKPHQNRNFDSNKKYTMDHRDDRFKKHTIIVRDDRIPSVHQYDQQRQHDAIAMPPHKHYHRESNIPSSSAPSYSNFKSQQYALHKHHTEDKRSSRSSSSKSRDRRESHRISRRSVSRSDRSSHRSESQQRRKRPHSPTKGDDRSSKRSRGYQPKSKKQMEEKNVGEQENQQAIGQEDERKHPADPLEVDWRITEEGENENDVRARKEEDLSVVMRRFTPASLLKQAGIMGSLLPDHLVDRCNEIMRENASDESDEDLNKHLQDITKNLNSMTDGNFRNCLNGKVKTYQHKIVPPLVVNGKTYGISVKHYINCTEAPREL